MLCFSKTQWANLLAKITAVVAAMSPSDQMRHELDWTGNRWELPVPGVGLVVFHEYYQRWTMSIRGIGAVNEVEGLDQQGLENAIIRLYNQVEWRPEGPAACEQRCRESEQLERERRRQQLETSLLDSLS
jgi:hypothetical protein